ncbi:MAG TPA: [protein-PII] uridylyltransferase [Rhizomicrobium sp.]|jgi:[protein-PII] uridylyltransferase
MTKASEKVRRAENDDSEALHDALAAIARAEGNPARRRAAALSHLQSVMREARAIFAQRLANRAWSGLRMADQLCVFHDGLLRALYTFAVEHLRTAKIPIDAERLAIVATGGYGRGMLAPFSDLDLLFLRSAKQGAWGEGVIEFVLLMLWDIGLRVGHAARSVPESIRLAGEDMTIRTSLLEARFVCGDHRLAQGLRAQFRSEFSGGSGRDFVDAKLAERDARHRKQGESRYLVEPNVKDGKGGLRDLQSLYWIGKYLYGVETPAELAAHGVFTRGEHATFRDAESFLWEVRCHLHAVCGRAEERLTFDVQPMIAASLGYDGADPRQTTESFMRDYFLVAKNVGDLTRIFCAALEEQHRKDRPVALRLLPGFLKLRDPQDEIYMENGRLDASDDAFRKNPADLIRIFQIAAEKNVDIHPDALRTVNRSLDLISDALRADETANRLFLSILSSRNDPERSLRLMNESGVLARFVPPFAHAVARMQFNMYHHYTVDEHLIRTVGQLASLEHGDCTKGEGLATDVMHRIGSRDALYCAAFLHDIGKGVPGDHSEAGASAALDLCRRWGLSEDDTATAVWLVRHHLLMSDTAQRRDIADPATVRAFVAEIQSPERLRLLFALTVADIRAVGPGVWNAWKSRLLRELYYAADAAMSGAAPARTTRADEVKALLFQRLADFPEEDRREAISHFGEPYWLSFDADALERNARVRAEAMRAPERFAFHGAAERARPVCEIVVCAADRTGLFFRLARAIAACGGSIAEAKAFTSDDGFALDVFAVHDGEGRPFGDAERLEVLRDALARASAGETPDVDAIIRRPEGARAAAFEVLPKIHLDNDASATATVLEVEGADRPGFLSDIAHALMELHLSISSAIVATYGEKAVDVFYVRDLFGNKVVQPDRRARIVAHLTGALTGGS